MPSTRELNRTKTNLISDSKQEKVWNNQTKDYDTKSRVEMEFDYAIEKGEQLEAIEKAIKQSIEAGHMDAHVGRQLMEGVTYLKVLNDCTKKQIASKRILIESGKIRVDEAGKVSDFEKDYIKSYLKEIEHADDLYKKKLKEFKRKDKEGVKVSSYVEAAAKLVEDVRLNSRDKFDYTKALEERYAFKTDIGLGK